MPRHPAAIAFLILGLGACTGATETTVSSVQPAADTGASEIDAADAGASDAAGSQDPDAAGSGEPDATAPVDAAATEDTSLPTDVGGEADTGNGVDTGGEADTGNDVDAGESTDAGDETDAPGTPAPEPGYYVSPAGDDANPGTSPALAWKTISRANQAALQPGDRLFFEGGESFTGTLTFDASDRGTPADPVVVSTYGQGRATLDAGDGRGIFVYNTAGLEVSGLDVVGSGRASNTADGVLAYVDLPGDVKLEHLSFDDLDVSGFGKSGIIIGADNANSGFRDVRITHSRSHDNAVAGIQVYGAWSTSPTGYAMEDLYIGHCVVHGNTGIAGQSHHTGNGIVIGGVDGGVIERSVAYDNGALNDAVGGPIGIWAWDSNDIVIQYNEAYSNRTRSRADGGGFDLDGGVTNSVMQYNYSHDNDGAGFLLAQFSGASRPFSNNVVRYNISQNDGRRNGYAGIDLWTASSENASNPIRDISIYGNTVFVSPTTSGGTPAALRIIYGTRTVNVEIHNNLFVTTNGLPLASIPSGQDGLIVHHNAYWSSGDPFEIDYYGASYASLQAWRQASGHETFNGAPVGLDADPLLTAPGGGATLGDATLLPTLQAYKLGSTSPLIDAGLDLGWGAGVRDYYGTTTPLGPAPDIGAHEVR